MAKKDIKLTKFTVKYPYKKGFFRGKREGSAWELPSLCPCCGAEAEDTLPDRVECDAGNRKYWYDFQVPYCATCLEHARARKGEAKAANTLGVIAGLLVGGVLYAALWQYRGGGDPFKAVKNWEVFAIIMAGVITWAAAGWLLKRHYTGRAGAELPRTENCTAPLKMELTLDNVRILSEPDLVMNIFCANAAFADALRAKNPGAFAEEEEITAVAERTLRGDLVIVDTMRIPTEEEIAAGG
jgi:hypothetical protein